MIMAMILLAFSVVFGGASQNHVLRLTVVELAALPLLVMAGGRLITEGSWREHRFALIILGVIVAMYVPSALSLSPTREERIRAQARLAVLGADRDFVPPAARTPRR